MHHFPCMHLQYVMHHNIVLSVLLQLSVYLLNLNYQRYCLVCVFVAILILFRLTPIIEDQTKDQVLIEFRLILNI